MSTQAAAVPVLQAMINIGIGRDALQKYSNAVISPFKSIHDEIVSSTVSEEVMSNGVEGRLADLHEFDASTSTWRRLADPPDVLGRGGATLEASSDGKSLWLLGGFAGHETNDLLQFDLASETWRRMPSEWLRPRSVTASFSLVRGRTRAAAHADT